MCTHVYIEKYPFLSNIFALHCGTRNAEYEPDREIKKKMKLFYLIKCDAA
jgi:hypothetical protein